MALPTASRASTPAVARMGQLLVLLALLSACVFGGRGITREASVSLQGDMPRHLMNGVFIHDFIASPEWTVDGVVTYATHYFAQYPALSLGHHPPLLPMSLVPFFAVFGVSIFSGRLAVLAFFVVSTWLLYTLLRRQYGSVAGGWAALLFATNAFMITYAQEVLSEMLTVMLVLAALNVLMRFRDTGRLTDYLGFLALAATSLIAKQLAAFLFPAYVVLLLSNGGWRRLRQRGVMWWSIAGLALAVPLVVATLILSPFNVGIVLDVFTRGVGFGAWREVVDPILQEHLLPSLGIAMVAGLLVAIIRRDGRVLLGVWWVLAVVAGVLFITGPYDVARYAIYAIPAYCYCAASLAREGRGWPAVAASVALAIAVVAQLPSAAAERPAGAGGYEEAARFVLENDPSPTVLYSASIDTGYFVFFMRKHDPARRNVVLRSDKILSTSLMSDLSLEERIRSPAEIYPILDRFGTRFIVIEDRPSGAEVIDWLTSELKGDRFIERRRIPIATTDRRLRGVDLVVFEYRDVKPADPDAALDMSLPLAGREIHVRLGDLVPVAPPPPR